MAGSPARRSPSVIPLHSVSLTFCSSPAACQQDEDKNRLSNNGTGLYVQPSSPASPPPRAPGGNREGKRGEWGGGEPRGIEGERHKEREKQAGPWAGYLAKVLLLEP